MARKKNEDCLSSGLIGMGLWLWGLGVYLSEALASVGVVLCGVGLLLQRPAVRLPRGWEWSLVLFIAWSLLAPTLAGQPPNGTGAIRTLHWLAVPMAAVTLERAGTTGRRRVAVGVGCALAVSLGVACLQHFGLWPRAEVFVPWRWTRIPFDRVYEPIAGEPNRYMAGGLIFHRLKLAHVAGLTVPWLVAWGAIARGGMRRWLSWGLAVAATFGIAVLALARAAALSTLVGLAVLAIAEAVRTARLRRPIAIAAGVAAVCCCALLLDSAFRRRLASSLEAEGNGDRAVLLRAGLRAVGEHPWVGVGPGRFRLATYAALDAPPHVRENAGKAHNQFLTVAAESGWVGLLLFLAMLTGLALRSATLSPFGAQGLASLGYFGALSMTHDPLFQVPFSLALMLALGAGITAERERPG